MKNKVIELQDSLKEIKKLFEEQNKALEDQKHLRDVHDDYSHKHLAYFTINEEIW